LGDRNEAGNVLKVTMDRECNCLISYEGCRVKPEFQRCDKFQSHAQETLRKSFDSSESLANRSEANKGRVIIATLGLELRPESHDDRHKRIFDAFNIRRSVLKHLDEVQARHEDTTANAGT